RLRSDDVGTSAAVDAADVDRKSARRIVEREQLKSLPRELVNGARALLGFDAGVRRNSGGFDPEICNALAGGLNSAAGQGRLEHEDGPTSTRLRLENLARRVAADFLVRRPDHYDAMRRQPARLDQDARGEERHRDAGLHVVGAGAVQPSGI